MSTSPSPATQLIGIGFRVHRAAGNPNSTVDSFGSHVSQGHSDRLAAELREKGVPVRYVTFPDEGHVITKLKNRIEFARQLETFLAEHLGGRAGSPD